MKNASNASPRPGFSRSRKSIATAPGKACVARYSFTRSGLSSCETATTSSPIAAWRFARSTSHSWTGIASFWKRPQSTSSVGTNPRSSQRSRRPWSHVAFCGKDRKSTRLNSSHLGISPLSLPDALPIFHAVGVVVLRDRDDLEPDRGVALREVDEPLVDGHRVVLEAAPEHEQRGDEPPLVPALTAPLEPRGLLRERSEEHTSELQSLRHLPSVPTRRSSDLSRGRGCRPARPRRPRARSRRGASRGRRATRGRASRRSGSGPRARAAWGRTPARPSAHGAPGATWPSAGKIGRAHV